MKYGIQNTEYGIQNTEYRIRNTDLYIHAFINRFIQGQWSLAKVVMGWHKELLSQLKI